MSSIMQYLIKQTNEFRDSYDMINTRVDTLLNNMEEVVDKLRVVEMKLKDIEIRVNNNRRDEIK